jgi:hypothetical protein
MLQTSTMTILQATGTSSTGIIRRGEFPLLEIRAKAQQQILQKQVMAEIGVSRIDRKDRSGCRSLLTKYGMY